MYTTYMASFTLSDGSRGWGLTDYGLAMVILCSFLAGVVAVVVATKIASLIWKEKSR